VCGLGSATSALYVAQCSDFSTHFSSALNNKPLIYSNRTQTSGRDSHMSAYCEMGQKGKQTHASLAEKQHYP
jgi:hypothetical protein